MFVFHPAMIRYQARGAVTQLILKQWRTNHWND